MADGVGLRMSRSSISVPLKLDLVVPAGAYVADVGSVLVMLGGNALEVTATLRAGSGGDRHLVGPFSLRSLNCRTRAFTSLGIAFRAVFTFQDESPPSACFST